MPDDGTRTEKVCLTCRHFDDHESKCQRFPPQVRVKGVDEDGEEYVTWEQPTIDLEWDTRCGEWGADNPDETVWQRMMRVGQRINKWKASAEKQDGQP